MKIIGFILSLFLLLSIGTLAQRPIVNHANTQLGELMELNDSITLVKNTTYDEVGRYCKHAQGFYTIFDVNNNLLGSLSLQKDGSYIAYDPKNAQIGTVKTIYDSVLLYFFLSRLEY